MEIKTKNTKENFMGADKNEWKSHIEAIALYLPQFHRVPENDEWWGNGFTEWAAVKGATPLFEGHNQPREPLNDNYYNLLDKSTMEWQANLAKEYRVSGFCFYHYWFNKGKQILEKPAENLLRWTDIDMPFCFCWANESWASTWSKLNDKNSWAEKYEEPNQIIRNETGVLLEQKYGKKKEWRQHFEYLLQFFGDKRYIKIDGKPVFMIYRPELMPCLEAMMTYWAVLAKAQGLPGLYIIAATSGKIQWDAVDAAYIRPNVTISSISVGRLKCFDYEKTWKDIINIKYEKDQKTFLCGLVDYDTTPRRGEKGEVVFNSNPKSFRKYFESLVKKSLRMGNEYVFLNAWNEWGEGMYLEPDKKNGYGYLNAVKEVMENCGIAPMDKLGEQSDLNDDIQTVQVCSREKERKYYDYFTILNRWLILKEKDISLETYLLDSNFFTIAIYGMGFLGLHLVEELKNSKIEIGYAIDQHADLIKSNIFIYRLEDQLPKVDAIIVTPIFEFDEIFKKLSTLVKCPIISLKEVVYES